MVLKLNNSDKTFEINDEDYLRMSKYSWRISDKGYVWTARTANGRFRTMYLHRILMCALDGQHIDHVDGNRLNNKRLNLRFCNNQQNAMNRKPLTKYGLKGVYKNGNRWYSKVRFNKKQYYLGTFKTKEEAALAYNIKATELFGSFAKLNNV